MAKESQTLGTQGGGSLKTFRCTLAVGPEENGWIKERPTQDGRGGGDAPSGPHRTSSPKELPQKRAKIE